MMRILFRSKRCLQTVVCTATLSVLPQIATAQIVTPTITYRGERTPDKFATAAEARANIDFEAEMTARAVMRVTQAHYPKDSMFSLTANRADRLVTGFPPMQVHGFQADPYSEIAAIAGRVSTAQQFIDKRLATPGISRDEAASVLQYAIQAFTRPEHPNQLPLAEQYAVTLDAMGAVAALQQYNAHASLVVVYYFLGRGDDVVRHGRAMFRAIETMPFQERHVFFQDGNGTFTYGAVVDAISGQPHGDAAIRTVNAELLNAATPSAAVLAGDSTMAWQGHAYHEWLQDMIHMSERIGQLGTPLVAPYWVNRGTARDSQSVPVNDGKIRVLEIGSFSCGSCMAGVSGLQRLHERYPDVEFNFLTWTEGMWGNRLVDPRTEAERVVDHFLHVKHITYPIGVALCHRVPDGEGGSEAVLTNPLWHSDQYPQISKPTLYILDGHGKIRRVIAGYNRNIETNLASSIEFLQKEASTHLL